MSNLTNERENMLCKEEKLELEKVDYVYVTSYKKPIDTTQYKEDRWLIGYFVISEMSDFDHIENEIIDFKDSLSDLDYTKFDYLITNNYKILNIYRGNNIPDKYDQCQFLKKVPLFIRFYSQKMDSIFIYKIDDKKNKYRRFCP